MRLNVKQSRTQAGLTIVLLAVLATAIALGAAAWRRSGEGFDPDEGVKGKRSSGVTEASVREAPAPQPVIAAAVPQAGFAPQTRLGYTAGDQWEPAIAADRSGHVYVL